MTNYQGEALTSDRAIQAASEDTLGRSSFVTGLSTAIERWHGRESLVIGLYGAWGTGKSSVKNLLIERLTANAIVEPAILDFNPWFWSGAESLNASFFSELAKVVSREGNPSDAAPRAERLSRYAKMLGFASNAAKVANAIAPYAGVPGLPLITEGLERATSQSSDAVKIGAEALEAQAKANTRTASEVKESLRLELSTLPRNVVVFVDDIDRLTPQEALDVFQVVKASADFPRIVYVLIMDQYLVSKNISHLVGGPGSVFLEKIVQLPFDIPSISRRKLTGQLTKGLDTLLTKEGIDERFQENQWAEYYHSGVIQLFSNLRDVKRYLASLEFHLGIFHRGKSFELNPADLVVLEMIRVFEPAVYREIQKNKNLLVYDLGRRFPELEKERDQRESVYSDIAVSSSEANRECIEKTLSNMFPLSGPNRGYGELQFNQRRICHHRVFDRYFQLEIFEDEISQYELDELALISTDRAVLNERFNLFESQGRLSALLEDLADVSSNISFQSPDNVISVLYEVGERLPEREGSLKSFKPNLAGFVERAVAGLINQNSRLEDRAKQLKHSLKQTNCLYVPTLVTANSQPKSRPGSGVILSDEARTSILANWASRLASAANDGALAKSDHLGTLLYHWSHIGDINAVRTWVREFTNSNKGFLRFLISMQSLGSSTNKGGDGHMFSRGALVRFLEVEELLMRLKKLSRVKLSESELDAVRNLELVTGQLIKGEDYEEFD